MASHKGSVSTLYTPYPNTNTTFGWNDALKVPVAYSKGYDSHAVIPRGARRAAAINASNALLSDGPSSEDFRMQVFVTNTSTDTSLNGSTAQSNLTRDFYPRNFVQPTITVSGASLDQEDYALLCEFIHAAQHKSLSNGYSNLTQLWVYGRNIKHPGENRGVDATRASGRRVTLSEPGTVMKGRRKDPDSPHVQDGTYFNQMIRGSHQPILAKGYVQEMPRVVERFTSVVTWEFPFVIAAMLGGIYSDAIVKPPVTKTWADMLADAQRGGVITGTASMERLNKKALQYANKHAATITP